MDDVQAVLQKADTHLTMIGALYGADLELQRVSPTLRAKIRAFLDAERSALDRLAERVAAAGAHVHFPLAPEAERFDASVGKNLPGLEESRPDLVATIARHQPFSVPALGRLRDLLVDEQRQVLTPSTRAAPDAVESAPPVEAPVATPPPAPSAGLGTGLTGSVFINGVEYDPVTLQPLHPTPAPRRETIFVDWLFSFEDGEASALTTLEAIHAAVASAIAEVSTAAGVP